MGQVLHESATTTEAVRRTIQLGQDSVRALARRYGVSPTTVQKWRGRKTTTDARMGPKEARSTVLSREDEAIIVAFRRHTLLPFDDCLYGLQPTLPHLTRSSLHRCLERHGISRLPELEGETPKRQRFATYPIGYVHVDSAESLPSPRRGTRRSSATTTTPMNSSGRTCSSSWKPTTMSGGSRHFVVSRHTSSSARPGPKSRFGSHSVRHTSSRDRTSYRSFITSSRRPNEERPRCSGCNSKSVQACDIRSCYCIGPNARSSRCID